MKKPQNGDMTELLTNHVSIVFLRPNNVSHVTLTYSPPLCADAERGGFYHGVDAGKNTIDSGRVFMF